MTMADELQKLHALREQGTLTEEEFQRAKQRILNEDATPEPPRAAQSTGVLHALQRSLNDRWIGGVCGGLAEITQVPSWTWRILFVLSALLHGMGVLVYLFLWIFVPSQKIQVLAK